MEDRHYVLCTNGEIKRIYKCFANHRFGDRSIGLLMKRDVYVLTEGERLFTNSSQGRGVYVFTDMERTRAFLAKEKNATANTWFDRKWFTQMWMRACDMGLRLYINLTPPGDKTLFANFEPDEDMWYPCCKDSRFRFTLPYGLKPNYKINNPNGVERMN